MKVSVDSGSGDEVVERAPGSMQRRKIIKRNMDDVIFDFIESLKFNLCSSFLEGRPAQGSHVLFSVAMLKNMVSSYEPGSSLV